MVSLRERKSRPSYASMAEGLANLSDEDELETQSKSPRASGSRSKSGSQSGSGSGSSSDSDSSSGSGEESSVSSGDSSEFDPGAENGDKRGRHKGKGKAKVGSGSKLPSPNDDDSSFEDEDEDSEDDLMDEDDEEDEPLPVEEEEEGDDTIPVQDSPRQKQSVTGPRPIRPIRIRQTIDANTYSPSDTKLLPRAYQDLLKSSARELTQDAKPVKNTQALKAHHDRMRVVGIEGFSTGPLTPFTTRLRSNPADHWASGQRSGQEPLWIQDEDVGELRQAKRRHRIWEWEIAVAVETPWQVWEGEGWWCEMKAGSANGASARGDGGKGKGRQQKPDGWRFRQELRSGLDDVGRLSLESLQLLTEGDAELYLPTLIDQQGNPWVSLRYGVDSEELIAMAMFESRSLGDIGSFDDGCVMCAGGPVWGMDWCPQGLKRTSREFLAVSALPHIETQPAIGERWPTDSQGCLQIWSLTPPRDTTGATMRCEMVLCVEGGNAMDIKWMPIGAWDESDMLDPKYLPKLGILAAAQLDGSIGLYSVPHPDSIRQARGVEDDGLPLFLKAHPLLRLQVDDAACTSLDWMSGTKLGVGLSNGHVAVWDVGEALKSGSNPVLPMAYIQVVASPIRNVTAARMPPGDAQGLPQHAVDSPYLVAGSYDGNAIIADTRDIINVVEMNHQRTPIVSTGFCSQLAAPIYGDGDYNVVLHKLYGQATNRSSILVMHRGPVWSISTSDYHTMSASGSADGSVLIANFNAGWHKRKGAPIMFHRRFEVDYDTESGEYRMLDRFQVEYVTATDALDRGLKNKKADKGTNPALMKSLGWAPQCAVHKVAWNSANGLESAGWLASGMASGLVRVEWVAGRFQGGQPPSRMTNPVE